MPAPVTPILDNFNRANEKPLASGWGAFRGADTGEIVTNVLELIASASIHAGTLATVYSGHQQAYMDVPGTGTPWIEVWLCASGATNATAAGYSFEFEAGTFRLVRTESGEKKTSLATKAGTIAAGDAMFIDRLEGGLITGWLRHEGVWTEIVSATDTLFTSGKLGWAVRATASTWKIDNFGGGQVPEIHPNRVTTRVPAFRSAAR